MKKLIAILLALSVTDAAAQWSYSGTDRGKPREEINGGTGSAPVTRLNLRRDTNANRLLATPQAGEPFWATDRKALYVGDGTTAGGVPVGAGSGYALFRVVDYGATCDGTTDDTADIQEALDACEAVGGCRLEFPAGKTCRVQPTAADTPIFTIGSSNITFLGYGATIKVTATASNDLTSIANERRYGFVFTATAKSNIHFFGLTFDGNRDDTVDPHYGFLRFFACDRWSVQDMEVKNTDNDQGALSASGYNYTTSAHGLTADVVIRNVRFVKNASSISISEGSRNITVADNSFLWSDISPTSYSTGRFGETRTLRTVRFNGFTITPAPTASTAAPRVENVVIRGNKFIGSHFAIELWNNDDVEGDDPTFTSGIVIADNSISKAFWGISVVTFNDVVVANNSYHGMTDDDVTYYEGETNSQADADLMHVGIEARGGYGITVSGNSLRGDWSWDAVEGSLNGGEGIAIGIVDAATKEPPDRIVVSGNTIEKFTSGIKVLQAKNVVITGNRVEDSFYAVISDLNISDSGSMPNSSVSPWDNNLLEANVFLGSPEALGVSPSASPKGSEGVLRLQGRWDIIGNTIVGADTFGGGNALLSLLGWDATGGNTTSTIGHFVIRNNLFRKFAAAAIYDAGATATAVHEIDVDGNLFDSEQGSPGSTVGVIRVERNVSVNKRIKFGRNTAKNIPRVVLMGATVGALTETYDFGDWDTDGSLNQPWRNTSGGSTITGGVPTVSFGPRRLMRHVRLNSGTGTGDPILDLTSMLPAKSVIYGVIGEVAGNITASTGTTGFSIGTTTDDDAWGAGYGLTTSQQFLPSNWTVGANSVIQGGSAGTLRITATGGADPYFTDGYLNLTVLYQIADGDAVD